MSRMIPCFLLACVIWSIATPAFAGGVSREPFTPAEDADFAAQQAQDADEFAAVAGGDGVVLVLAVVGVVFLVLYLTGNL
ncbi:MAG TPA: hypothetical protein VLI39_06385 [Sedimentisphaerales bacterium]|nr:hypothetical protein [Sedimentisphaerales bacterium]